MAGPDQLGLVEWAVDNAVGDARHMSCRSPPAAVAVQHAPLRSRATRCNHRSYSPPTPLPRCPRPRPHPRRLLQTYMEAARRKGVPAHSVVVWVRRKLGAGVLVLRRRADGTLGCAAPCVWCARELLRFDLRVHCTLGGGGFFSGRLSETGAPCPGLTGGQKRMLGKYK